ncbi:MAG TPA: PhoU domain-containing protein [Candidatus Angelobacter sp.]|nr:PhoU domain-containing protein [Candidatus Angelobacter sp.]
MIRAVPALQIPGKEISVLLASMARETEIAVDCAIDSLLTFSEQSARRVLEKENLINQTEMAIDQKVFSDLKAGHLTGPEIRDLLLTLKMNKDLERVGDLATSIARRVMYIMAKYGKLDWSELQPMAIAVSHVCRQTLRALMRRDLLLAKNAISAGQSVVVYRDYVLNRLYSQTERPVQKEAVSLMLASRSLEQIADHAGNVAENLVLFLGGPEAEPEQLAS